MTRRDPIRHDARGWPRPPHFADPDVALAARALYDAIRRGKEDRFFRLVGMPMRRLLKTGSGRRVAPPVAIARLGTGQRALRRLVAYGSAICAERNARFIAAHGGIDALMVATAP